MLQTHRQSALPRTSVLLLAAAGVLAGPRLPVAEALLRRSAEAARAKPAASESKRQREKKSRPDIGVMVFDGVPTGKSSASDAEQAKPVLTGRNISVDRPVFSHVQPAPLEPTASSVEHQPPYRALAPPA